jgi:two-component system chemotaxis response regulator CheY
MLRLLIADESEAVRKIAAHILQDMGFAVIESASALDAFSRSQAGLPNVMIVDSGLTGALDLIANIRSLPNGNLTQIYYSVTKADLRSLMAGKKAGASDFLLKPFDSKVLGAALGYMAAAARPAKFQLDNSPVRMP